MAPQKGAATLLSVHKLFSSVVKLCHHIKHMYVVLHHRALGVYVAAI
jgi:hypothetical protein